MLHVKSGLADEFQHVSHFFFFNDTATTEIYTLSLHDALPISVRSGTAGAPRAHARHGADGACGEAGSHPDRRRIRSEEHTSELQSRLHLVCRLLLEKKKQTTKICSAVTDSTCSATYRGCVMRS